MDSIKAQKTNRRRTLLLVILAAAALGFLAQIQWIGYVMIGAYAVVAHIRRLSSRLTFTLALFALGMTAAGVVVNWSVAQNFAAYSFVLFVLGALQVAREERRYYVK